MPARKALAVVSAERNEGRSFIAANLAMTFSQLGEHTLLIDADMRNPRQHALFGLTIAPVSRQYCPAAAGRRQSSVFPALRDLSVLPAGAQPPNPLELLARPIFSQLLKVVWQAFDVILLDSPAAAEFADAQTLAVRAGAALIVVRTNTTRMWKVRGVAETVAHASATVVGAVLNDF